MALWRFNKLIQMTNYEELIEARNACTDDMDDEDKNYLLYVDDDQQYPAARCAMGETIIMYGRTSSQQTVLFATELVFV
jgi:hypothetical protein